MKAPQGWALWGLHFLVPFPLLEAPRLMAPSPSLNQNGCSPACAPTVTPPLRAPRRVTEPRVPSDGPAGPCSGPHTLGLLRGWLPTAGVSSAGALDKDLSFLPASTGSNGHQVGARPPAPKPQALQAGGLWGGVISGGGGGGRRAAPLASTHLLTRGDVLAPFPSSQEPPELEANVSNSSPLPSRHSPPRRP